MNNEIKNITWLLTQTLLHLCSIRAQNPSISDLIRRSDAEECLVKATIIKMFRIVCFPSRVLSCCNESVLRLTNNEVSAESETLQSKGTPDCVFKD